MRARQGLCTSVFVLLCGAVLLGRNRPSERPVLVPAFPGAEGAGALASGGRGGTVYRVTNLNLSGPGSLAEAVSAPNRFVVFAVSGAIDLGGGAIEIAHPNITIAGQTAPGEGIALIHGSLGIRAGNVIVRHIRVRRGFIRKGDMGDAISIKGRDFENVIVDHVSTAWATDENLTLTNANRVTAQYAIIAEALDYFNPMQTPPRHAFGSLFGSMADGGRMSIHHCLYAHNRLRNARTTAGGRIPPVLDFRNNVIYDCKEATSHTGSQAVHGNWVGNYYKDGPSTGIEGFADEVSRIIFAFHSAEKHRLYISGNYVFGSPERSADNWLAVAPGRRGKRLVRLEDVRLDRPLPAPPVTTQPALEAYETVLEEAGATLPSRDAIDTRIVADVRNGTGAVINYESDIPEPGRWQTYYSLPTPPDSDQDGLPDYWEAQFGVTEAMEDADGDGYANIEEYVNNTHPRGGSQPIVYVSAQDSRAYRADGDPGEFRIFRTGAEPVQVIFRLDGRQGAVNIPRGARYAKIPVSPGARAAQVVLELKPGPGYAIGCPPAALVAIVDGRSPRPVRLADLDPDGGASEEDRRLHAEVLRKHEVKRKIKIEARKQ